MPADVPGGERAISSNEIFDLARFPRRLVVVGGGYIACEFASIFNGLGAQVTQLYRGEQILRGFDLDVRNFVAAEMTQEGRRHPRRREGARPRGGRWRRDAGRPRRRQRARRRHGALRDGARSQHGGARTRSGGRRARRQRRGGRRRALPHQRAEHPCDRRRDRPRPADAGRARRGDGVGRRPVRRRRAARRLHAHPDGGLHPSQHRHHRPVRRRRARRASRRSVSIAPSSRRCATRCRGAASAP